ncbi:hypothetical protein [Bradyrhizobium murdochi]|uniref:hypothetical protein n=1 Tax=Bradyrhizobium murdochi TaxID=1038859 RepID=UPI0003F900C3|nr:hypothetical protein [Bradyrhizobium murdochi]
MNRLVRPFSLSVASKQAALILALLALLIASNSHVALIFPSYISPLHFSRLSDAVTAIALNLCPLPLFILARFSFGYVVALWMYGMIAGFIFLSYSTTLEYNHDQARISALLCLISFLVPALFLRLKITPFSIMPRTMDALMIGALIASAAVVAACAMYGFRLAGLLESLAMREEVVRPRLLNYLSGIASGAILPFCFAYFALNRRWVPTAIAAILLLSFFPVLLNKTVLMAPAWLVFLLVLYTVFNPKMATVLSILIPLTLGAGAYFLLPDIGRYAIGYINFRMIAIPSLALDHYFAFFSTHPYTNFCQINFVRLFTDCPYTEQLGIILKREYDLGNFNGSLFTTEGIASVGPVLAPISTFVCGIIIGLGNVASARLSPPLIAVSSGILVQALMNVPLSTVLLSNGGAALFALWFISHRGK